MLYDSTRGSLFTGTLVNCSRHGIAVTVRHRLRNASYFLLTIPGRPEILAVYAVKRCRKSHGSYEVGAALVGVIDAPDEARLEAMLSALLST